MLDPIGPSVKYRVIVMFMIAVGASPGSMGMVLLSCRRLFNARHQPLSGRIKGCRK